MKMAATTSGLVVTAALALFSTGSAHSATYYFEGNCEDCAAAAGSPSFPVSGLLELQGGPVQNASIDAADFIQWTYSGSNLLDPYIVLPGDVTRPEPPWVSHTLYAASGAIVGGAIKTLNLAFGDGLEFLLTEDGKWSTCGVKDGIYYAVPCSWQNSNDFGVGRFVNTPTIPEPGSWALLGMGLLGLAWSRRARPT